MTDIIGPTSLLLTPKIEVDIGSVLVLQLSTPLPCLLDRHANKSVRRRLD
jgi:hypothetical protein